MDVLDFEPARCVTRYYRHNHYMLACVYCIVIDIIPWFCWQLNWNEIPAAKFDSRCVMVFPKIRMKFANCLWYLFICDRNHTIHQSIWARGFFIIPQSLNRHKPQIHCACNSIYLVRDSSIFPIFNILKWACQIIVSSVLCLELNAHNMNAAPKSWSSSRRSTINVVVVIIIIW